MSEVFRQADAPVPPFYALLEQVRREVPAIEHDLVIGPDNKVTPRPALSARARALLHDYRLVQYDFSVGNRYAVDEMFYGHDRVAEALRPGEEPAQRR
jgi:hypothetical protein